MSGFPKDAREFRDNIFDLFRKDQAKVIPECSALIADAAKGGKVSRQVLALAHMMRGNMHIFNDDYQNALKDLHESNNLDIEQGLKHTNIPSYMASHINTAGALAFLRHIFAAVRQLQTMLVEDPSKSKKIVHYTELRALKNLAQKQPFRLYNVGYMNDPEEGEVFLKIVEEMSGCNIRDCFYSGKEKNSYSPAYVGSFVRMNEKEEEQENGNLFLWRTYGKNEKQDGAGACIHFNAGGFSGTTVGGFGQMVPYEYDEHRDCIYRVAYESQVAPKKDKKLHSGLMDLAKSLELGATTDWKGDEGGVYKVTREMLDQIRFLFKSDYYAAEEELRIVQSHDFDESGQPIADDDDIVKIDTESFPPRFFVEVKNLPLETVILGPTVRGVREWKQWLKKKNNKLEVRKSEIPYGERN
ncbi:MAG: hypothetical protein MPK31_06865 [Gammaproteobacteria bacterium]|nr:hypothetical protein [Gammaproteobacteria bacterium]MDA8002778.1 hypothetical protein [Alphaproteobacteria bacterium]